VSDSRPSGALRAQLPVRVLDLSLGGGLLVSPVPFEVGAIHDFAIEVGGDAFWAQCEIRHCREADRGPGYHVGVQFVGIDPQDERRLRDYLSHR
jgi:c-di-GMP-binding flagellar brake protein YcgR